MPVTFDASAGSLASVSASDFSNDFPGLDLDSDSGFNEGVDLSGSDFSGSNPSNTNLPALESHGVPLDVLMNLPDPVRVNPALLSAGNTSASDQRTPVSRASATPSPAPEPAAPWQLAPESRTTIDNLFARERANLDAVDATKGYFSGGLGASAYYAANEYRGAIDRAEQTVNSATSEDQVRNALIGLQPYQNNVTVWSKVGVMSNDVGATAGKMVAVGAWETAKGAAMLTAPPVAMGMQAAEVAAKQYMGEATTGTYAAAAMFLIPGSGALAETGTVLNAGKTLKWAAPLINNAVKSDAAETVSQVSQALNNGPVNVALQEGKMVLQAGGRELSNYYGGVDQTEMGNILQNLHIVYGQTARLVQNGADMAIEVGGKAAAGARVLMETVGGSSFTHTPELAKGMKAAGETGRVMIPLAGRSFTIVP